ncbi:terpenoid cyclases/Protein prenyltransferase [Annulohypoxylon truncatum]|uniref:terpenoid cyclases/Protein prenyltransferase n=1 Tax=Annulohypoxylon truncatum TaxID=327061 RepID=UPI00200727E0|nr:terpenoid cyclases/Protein prenyltransferase [Annulohypoxylon truncatum]KAI1211324.1 terpenoid cyclases/Protein prenyltransferase [Annulohypoxylon truncatum]
MPIKTNLARARRRNTHKGKTMASLSFRLNPTYPNQNNQDETLNQNDNVTSTMASSAAYRDQKPEIPDLFTSPPPIQDTLSTKTSTLQNETVDDCLPFLTAEVEHLHYNQYGIPHLARERHIKFLRKHLERLPGRYVALDASRPWMLYWSLNGLAILGEDVSCYRDALVETARSMQNTNGGFGGGIGHESHLACTYSMVLALSVVGGESAYEVIDRRALWKWLCALKRPDGGFQMAVGGEVDIRGAYCAAVLVTLLNLPLDLSSDSPAWTTDQPNLFSGLGDYVRQCQSFEGGISAQPDGEAHGAYAFCALGCLAILGAPHRTFARYLDVPRLISWLSSRQYAPEGGLGGRTNKLVDGCYSHWVGCCWPLIEASLAGPSSLMFDVNKTKNSDIDIHNLYSREGLVRYILCCAQETSKRGGMRDKPGKSPDAYHTCYVLSGLSSAQHVTRLLSSDGQGMMTHSEYDVSPHHGNPQIYDEEDRVSPTDPVYFIPEGKRKEIMSYFLSKPGF